MIQAALNIFSKLDKENILSIFKDLGEGLGKIHSDRVFNYADGWDEKIKADNFQNYKIRKLEQRMEEIEN